MTPDASAPARTPPGAGVTLAGRYRLVDQVGAGGMGSVWEAEDLSLGRRVAVKLPADPARRDRQHLERFAREATAAARLSHPNVALVLDYGDHEGEPFMVLELLDGETLADRLRRGPMPIDEVVGVAEGIAAALDAAHAAGVVHRDVKPANVMLTPDGVKVMDFGIATGAWAPAITTTGIVGTAAYLSPEQAAGEAARPASDIYALGVVVYELLAGRPPFAAENPVAVVAAHLHRDPPPLRELAPGTPPHVAAAVEQALAKDPARRPATASAFARSLRGPGAAGDAPLHSAAAETRVIAAPTPTEVLPPARPVLPPARPVRARRSGRAWAAGAALLLVLGLLASASASGDGLGDPSGGEAPETTVAAATVPDVVGQPVQDAIGALEGAGLAVGEVRTVEGPLDTVMGTDPVAGTDVPQGTTITLAVGAGAEPEPVDDGEDDEEDEDEGRGNGNGRPSCDTDPSHPSCD